MKRNEQKEIESRLLSQKNILSYILRETIKEFANMDLTDIAQLIGDDILISRESVESGDYLSVKFYVQMKSGYSQILINIEAEDSENQIEQDFLTQGIVQLCKLVASQNENNLIMSQFKNMLNMQIPAHLTTHSAKNWSDFPDVTERVSASADQ